MIGVQQWAEIRRMKFVEGLSAHEIHRRTGLHRKTIRRAPRDIQVVDGGGGAKVTLVVSVEGEDVERLERLAAARGQRPAEVVSALLRNS